MGNRNTPFQSNDSPNGLDSLKVRKQLDVAWILRLVYDVENSVKSLFRAVKHRHPSTVILRIALAVRLNMIALSDLFQPEKRAKKGHGLKHPYFEYPNPHL